MVKKYGIGFTVFEYHGGVRTPVSNFKAFPDNVSDAMRVLDKKLKAMGRNQHLVVVLGMTFVYAFSIRSFVVF
jgi:hypothetical protein